MKYTIHQAKSQLSRLIQKALRGEEVIIANRDKPLVTLRALGNRKRRIGFSQAEIKISGDFDSPLEDFKDYT